MKKPVQFAIWIWAHGVDDFLRFCLPSILQPNNIPWLARNGYVISLDFYTIAADRQRVGELAGQLQEYLRGLVPDGDITATLTAVPPDVVYAQVIKTTFFETIVRKAVATDAHVMLAFADMYFGDGSIRNIMTYGQKPRVSVSGLYLRVKQQPFSRLLGQHPGESISNARLVDICLDTLIDGMQASIVDEDRNASYVTSGALRRISDDLYTYTFHAPTPILFTFEESDLHFFERFLWNYSLLDHIWPTMLIAQNRWRVMASSDLFFLAELNHVEVETGVHTFPMQDGMLYNDDYEQEHLHGRIHQTILMTLRRERPA
jgi:hypothetical protein